MKPLDIILKNIFKYSPLLVLSFMLLFVGKLAYDYKKDADESKRRYEELVGIKEDYKQISEYVATLETEYASQKDIWKRAEESWKSEKKLLEVKIKALASATFTIKNFPLEQDAPDLVTEDQLIQEVQFVSENQQLGPAVGVVKIENKTGKTYSKMYDHEIKVDSAITKDEDGRVRVLAKAWYIQREESLDGSVGKPNWKDIPYPLPITGGSIVIDPRDPVDVGPTKKRFLLAPHLNAGLFAGMADRPVYGGRVGISSWGYGLTKNDLDYKLGELGFNFSNDYVDLSLVPVQYRIGNHLPLIEDTYIGAGVGVTPTTRSVFLNLSTTF